MGYLNTVALQVKTILEGVENMHVVSERMGGEATWATRRKPLQSYAEIEITAVREQAAGIGPTCWRFADTVVTVLMPFSYENPNSTERFRDLLDALVAAIRANLSLGCSVTDTMLPSITEISHRGISSGNNLPEVVCHYARLTFTVKQYVPFSTA